MNFITPMVAGIAAAALIPALVLLYFLKLRRRDVEVSSTLLWKKSVRDMQANAPFQKLRRNILLFLQLLALAAGLFGAAQPEWRSQTPAGGKSVILIDRSASMSATDEDSPSGEPQSRLERARREALEYVDSMRSAGLWGFGTSDEAMVIAFDSSAEVVQPFTKDKSRLRAALESVTASDAPGSIDEALRLAGAYAQPIVIEGRGLVIPPGPPIVMWSDGDIEGLSRAALPPESRVTYRAMGKSGAVNVGITALRAERTYDRPNEASIFVGLQSTDRAERTVDVELSIEGLVAAVRSVTMPAAPSEQEPSVGGVVFVVDRTASAVVQARLVVDDALASDNTSRLVIPPARRLSIALVTSGLDYLRDALEGLGVAKLTVMSPAQAEAALASGGFGAFDLVVLDRWSPAADAQITLPPGRYLAMGVVPNAAGMGTASTEAQAAQEKQPEAAYILDWQRDHPALFRVNLANIVLARPLAATLGDGTRVLAQSTSGPAIVEAQSADTRVLATLFDPTRGTWLMDVSFVVFLGQAMRWLSDTGALEAEAARPGQTLTTRLPTSVSEATLRLPGDERVRLVPSADGTVTYGPLRRAGLYTVSWEGPPGPSDPVVGSRATRFVPVNMLDSRESAVRSLATLAMASGDVSATSSGTSAGGMMRLWPWCLLAACALLMVEWIVYHRRVQL